MLNSPSNDKTSKHEATEKSFLASILDHLGFLFLIAVVVSLWEIIARYVFHSPTIWAHETTIFLVALGYLTAGIHVLLKDKHIRITLLSDVSNNITRKYLTATTAIATCLFLFLSAYAAFPAAQAAWLTPHGYLRAEGTGSAWNPATPALIKTVLALSLAIMAGIALKKLISIVTSKNHSSMSLTSSSPHASSSPQLATIALIAISLFATGLIIIYGEQLGLGVTTLLIIGLMMSYAVIGIPLAFATGLVAMIVTLGWFDASALPLVTSRIYSFTNEYVLVAVPMFVLMASILDRSNIAGNLYSALQKVTASVPGGLAIQTLLAGLFLAAISGIIGGEIVLLGLIALPQMLKRGYSKSIAIGTVCAGGSLGTMIPPSIVLIVYGLTASVSISDLFLATVTPGLLLALAYIIYIYCQCRWNPSHQNTTDNPRATRTESHTVDISPLISIGGPAFIMLSVLGSIYGGIASITEAACLGVVSSLLLTAARREMSFELLKESLNQTRTTCGMIIWVGIGASILVGVYNAIGGTGYIRELILGLDLAPWLIVTVMMAILLLLGLFMDWIGIALLTMPIFVPVISSLGFDPIWFGILFAVNMQVSYLSPPFGPAVFYLKSVAPDNITLGDIYRAVWPFIMIQLGILGLLITFPELALWLPAILNR